MRTIKFRGKAESGEWIYGDLIQGIGTDKKGAAILPINTNNFMDYILVNSETVGQYTGLHDKNGKEIYENWILRIKGKMGDNDEYSYDCYYKVEKISFVGVQLTLIGLVNDLPDSFDNSIPIHQRLSFEYRQLRYYENNGKWSIMLNDTYGENSLLRNRWKQNSETKDIEVIGNIYENPELLK